jgi:hypothetical protein
MGRLASPLSLRLLARRDDQAQEGRHSFACFGRRTLKESAPSWRLGAGGASEQLSAGSTRRAFATASNVERCGSRRSFSSVER